MFAEVDAEHCDISWETGAMCRSAILLRKMRRAMNGFSKESVRLDISVNDTSTPPFRSISSGSLAYLPCQVDCNFGVVIGMGRPNKNTALLSSWKFAITHVKHHILRNIIFLLKINNFFRRETHPTTSLVSANERKIMCCIYLCLLNDIHSYIYVWAIIYVLV